MDTQSRTEMTVKAGVLKEVQPLFSPGTLKKTSHAMPAADYLRVACFQEDDIKTLRLRQHGLIIDIPAEDSAQIFEPVGVESIQKQIKMLKKNDPVDIFRSVVQEEGELYRNSPEKLSLDLKIGGRTLGIPASRTEVVELPEAPFGRCVGVFDCDVLRQGIERALPIVSKDQTRPVLNALLFRLCGDGVVKLVATDS